LILVELWHNFGVNSTVVEKEDTPLLSSVSVRENCSCLPTAK
jgi:hypothetical protein